MKKFFTITLIILASLLLVSCDDNIEESDEVIVYFYEYRNSYKKDELNPDNIYNEVYKIGDKIKEPVIPERQGYVFSGWYLEPAKRNLWDFENHVVARNIVLYADWEPGNFKVNLELNGGEFPANTNFDGEFDDDGNPYYDYEANTSQTLHTPGRTGYKFLGWYVKPEYRPGDKRINSVERDITEDVTYYAHWEALRIIIRFNLNVSNYDGLAPDPSVVEPTAYAYGQENDFPVLVDTSGKYNFLGWNTRRNGSGDMLINGEPFEREQTTVLYAQWELK